MKPASSMRSHLLPATVFAMLVATAACNREAPAPEAATPAAATVPVAQFDARLNLVDNNGNVHYDGTVGTDAARDAIVAALQRAYPGRLSGGLKVERGARPAPWQEALPKFLETFTMPGAAVTFEGRRIQLSGHAGEDDRKALLARAELLYPGYAYDGLFQGVGDVPADAATAVLAQVKPGTSGGALVKALNEAVTQTPIRFQPGSAQVAPDSLALLSKAAQVIQAAGDDTRLQITGPAADDASLAQQRAEAIKVQLIVNGVSPAALETTAQAGSGDAVSFRLL